MALSTPPQLIVARSYEGFRQAVQIRTIRSGERPKCAEISRFHEPNAGAARSAPRLLGTLSSSLAAAEPGTPLKPSADGTGLTIYKRLQVSRPSPDSAGRRYRLATGRSTRGTRRTGRRRRRRTARAPEPGGGGRAKGRMIRPPPDTLGDLLGVPHVGGYDAWPFYHGTDVPDGTPTEAGQKLLDNGSRSISASSQACSGDRLPLGS